MTKTKIQKATAQDSPGQAYIAGTEPYTNAELDIRISRILKIKDALADLKDEQNGIKQEIVAIMTEEQITDYYCGNYHVVLEHKAEDTITIRKSKMEGERT